RGNGRCARRARRHRRRARRAHSRTGEIRLRPAILVVLAALAGCSKNSSDSAPAASGTAATSASAAHAAPSGSAPLRAPSAERASFAGSYTAKVGAVEPPKNANEKTWVGDPGSVAVGKGAIDLVIGERGDARGDAKGPLGEMTVTGTYDGKEVRASLI